MTINNDSKDNTNGIRFDLQFFAEEGTPAPEPGPAADTTLMGGDPNPAPNPNPEPNPDPVKTANPDPNQPDPNAPKPDEKPTGAPEKYEAFTVPEGFTFDESATSIMKELNLSQEQAQKLVDYDIQREQKRQEAFQKSQVDNFTNVNNANRKTIEDKYGTNLQAEQANVARFIDQVSGSKENAAELRKFFNETGFGNVPMLFDLFAAAGKMLAEDKFVGGKPGGSGQKSAAEVLYPQ